MKEEINNLQLSSILFLLLFSGCFGILPYVVIQRVGTDGFISSIIGSLIGLIPLFILLYIFNYDIDNPIYVKTKIIFGKVMGSIINYLLVLTYLVIAVTILFNISNFIISQYLTNTPLILVTLVFGAVILHTIRKGIYTISKISFIYVIIIISLFILGVILLSSDIKVDNIKPILEFGINSPFITSIMYTLLFTSPMYSILVIPKNSIENSNNSNKYLVITYLLVAFMICFIIFISSAALGKYLIKIYQYPVYITLKKISIFGFIDRIENFLSVQFILSSFISLMMPIFYIKSSIKRDNNLFISFITTLIIVITSTFIFKSNTNFNNYLSNIYPYILIIPTFIYFVIFISIFIKKMYKK